MKRKNKMFIEYNLSTLLRKIIGRGKRNKIRGVCFINKMRNKEQTT